MSRSVEETLADIKQEPADAVQPPSGLLGGLQQQQPSPAAFPGAVFQYQLTAPVYPMPPPQQLFVAPQSLPVFDYNGYDAYQPFFPPAGDHFDFTYGFYEYMASPPPMATGYPGYDTPMYGGNAVYWEPIPTGAAFVPTPLVPQVAVQTMAVPMQQYAGPIGATGGIADNGRASGTPPPSTLRRQETRTEATVRQMWRVANPDAPYHQDVVLRSFNTLPPLAARPQQTIDDAVHTLWTGIHGDVPFPHDAALRQFAATWRARRSASPQAGASSSAAAVTSPTPPLEASPAEPAEHAMEAALPPAAHAPERAPWVSRWSTDYELVRERTDKRREALKAAAAKREAAKKEADARVAAEKAAARKARH
ncbi:hypothetical protein AAVH_23398 [Aphelenchoides avenae]|nr:hypothetical protein AAVH_23398 [Aphelenchus avenae]